MNLKEYYNTRFEYIEGILIWKTPFSNRLKIGQPAGTLENRDGTGYLTVVFDGKRVKNHRVIWIMHNGDIPEGLLIDHIDRDRLNNRLENLRLIDKSGNSLNTFRGEDVGISFDNARNKWRAQISINNKNVFLGRYKTKEEALAAYSEAEKKRSSVLWEH